MVSIIAHRGYSAKYRENSVAAWRAAVLAGADGIEVDVRRSADGHFVCCHDPDLRLAGHAGKVGSMTMAQIANVTIDHEPAAPMLQDAFSTIPSNCMIVLDVKEEGDASLLQLMDLIRSTGRRRFVLGLHSLKSVSFCRTRTDLPLLGLLDGGEADDEAFADHGGDILRLWESKASVRRIDMLLSRPISLWMTVGGWGTGRDVGNFDPVCLREMSQAGIAGFLVNEPLEARQSLQAS